MDPRHQWEHWAGWDPPRHPPHYSDDWPRWARAQSEPVQGMTNRVEHGSRELQPPPSEGCSRCTPRGEEIPTTVSQPYRYTDIYPFIKDKILALQNPIPRSKKKANQIKTLSNIEDIELTQASFNIKVNCMYLNRHLTLHDIKNNYNGT